MLSTLHKIEKIKNISYWFIAIPDCKYIQLHIYVCWLCFKAFSTLIYISTSFLNKIVIKSMKQEFYIQVSKW